MYSIIVATSINGCIGEQPTLLGQPGKIPWHYSQDFKWFKENTLNQVVVMGRRTYDSIGKPLPNRINCVISSKIDRDLENKHKDLYIFENIEHCREFLDESLVCMDKKIFIIGGAQIYKQFLEYCNEILMTVVPDLPDGDIFFPMWPLGWRSEEIVRPDAGELKFFRFTH